MMIPKELIERQRKAEDTVNRAHDRLEKAQAQMTAAVEELRNIQVQIAAILDGKDEATTA